MTKKSLKQVTKQYQQLGLHPTIIEIAYNNVKGDSTRILDEIFRLQSQSTSYPVTPSNQQDEDAQLSKAIQMSITQAKDKKISLQPLNPQQRVRKPGVPVGLKNIGNTCYFNSLLQTYFQNVQFVKQILKYEIPSKYQLTKQQIDKNSVENFQFKRKYASCKLVDNLKVLFAQMIGSDRKYIDPTPVLTSIVDDYGNQLPIGDQKDIGEFNLIFLSRIDEGLTEGQEDKRMEIQVDESKRVGQSPSKLKVLGQSTDDMDNEQFPTHSLLKHSSITLNTQSIITHQFIGKTSTSFHNQQQNLNKLQQELFSLLFVNVKNKELYQALEQVVITRIDDYRNEKGQVVSVEKRTWIKQAPKTLFFQIDRVGFDKQKGQLTKNNDPFDFPKEFYIDPFLQHNKQKALQIQFQVKKLRQQRQRYLEYVKQLQCFGKEKQSLIKNLELTMEFFKSQTNKMQLEIGDHQQPLVFPKLQHKITPQLLHTLQSYHQQITQKITHYTSKIQHIQQEIEHCYQSIRTQPYILYSILIHQGSAEMGHYYSYVYDIDSKQWRKYNDINITEEVQAQVLKQAKGVNATSAYYLVYAQRDVLTSHNPQIPTKTYAISSDEKYQHDLYSQFLSPKLRQQIIQQNHLMYHQIQQFKMGSFASRVIDSYTKKFEICNEIFRKNKPVQKKKNSPPLLINYPLYLKYIDQNLYKQSLIQHCCQQYGPKQYSPAFDEILTKKLSNFNQHKRPKDLRMRNHKHSLTIFMQQVYKAIAGKMIFNAIKEQSYSKIIVLLRSLLADHPGTYFNWLGTLLSKILVVHLLIYAQQTIPKSQSQTLSKLRLLTFILFKFIHLQQEKILHANCVFWLAELSLLFKDEKMKTQCDKLAELISQKKYSQELVGEMHLVSLEEKDPISEIRSMVEIADAAWNLSRTEDVLVGQLMAAREQVKEKIQSANDLYREMKKYNLPLQKSTRDKFVHTQSKK